MGDRKLSVNVGFRRYVGGFLENQVKDNHFRTKSVLGHNAKKVELGSSQRQ